MKEIVEHTATESVKFIAEDHGCTASIVGNRYDKGELCRRYVAILDDYKRLKEKEIEVDKKYESFSDDYEKLKENLAIFSINY